MLPLINEPIASWSEFFVRNRLKDRLEVRSPVPFKSSASRFVCFYSQTGKVMTRIRTILQSLRQHLRVKLQIACGLTPRATFSTTWKHERRKLYLLRPKSSPHSAWPNLRSQNVQTRRILRGCSDFPLSNQITVIFSYVSVALEHGAPACLRESQR